MQGVVPLPCALPLRGDPRYAIRKRIRALFLLEVPSPEILFEFVKRPAVVTLCGDLPTIVIAVRYCGA